MQRHLLSIFRKHNFSDLTATIIAIHLILTAVGYVMLGDSAYITLKSAALIIVFDAIMIASLRYIKSCSEILCTTAWFVIFFILPRLSQFQFAPPEKITFVEFKPFSATEIENTLIFVILGYISIVFGLYLSKFLFQKKFSSFENRLGITEPSNSYIGIAVFSILAFAFTIYVNFYLGISIFSADPQNWGSPQGWMARVFDTDVALMFAVVWLVSRTNEPLYKRIIVLAVVALWLVYSISSGSRGGPLRILILIGLASLATFGNPRTTLQRIVFIVLLSYAGGMITYPLGTVVRMTPTSGSNAVSALKNDWKKEGEAVEFSASSTRANLYENPTYQAVTGALSPIATRLGLIDYTIVIVTRPPANPAALDKYLSLSYGFKRFANNMVPGDIFPESDIMTSRVFNLAYRGYSEEHIRQYFLSEPWTLWGYSWIKGGPVFGLVIMLALAFVMQSGFEILRLLSGTLFPYVGTAYLFVPTSGGFLGLFGIDHWLTITAHFYISVSIALIIVWLCSKAYSRLRAA